MNKKTESADNFEISPLKRFFGRFNGKTKDVLLLGILALVLLFAVWKIFYTKDTKDVFSVSNLSDNEIKVMRLLHEIDGVGEASVVVCEGENEVQSVVIVCEGANDFRVVMDVREAVAAALNTQQKAVKIYLKNDERR